MCHVNSASILEPFEIWVLDPQNVILSIPKFRVLLNYAVFTAEFKRTRNSGIDKTAFCGSSFKEQCSSPWGSLWRFRGQHNTSAWAYSFKTRFMWCFHQNKLQNAESPSSGFSLIYCIFLVRCMRQVFRFNFSFSEIDAVFAKKPQGV